MDHCQPDKKKTPFFNRRVSRMMRDRKLQRLKVFDNVSFFLIGQIKTQKGVVVINNIEECREPAVMVESALLVGPEPLERCCPVHSVGRPKRLEIVYSNFCGLVHIISGFCIKGRNMAPGTVGFSL